MKYGSLTWRATHLQSAKIPHFNHHNQKPREIRLSQCFKIIKKKSNFNLISSLIFVNGVHPRLSLALESIIPKKAKFQKIHKVIKWDFLNDFQTQLCSSAEIITLFLLRNSFSIIWNITNYGCQAEARGNELWAWLLRSSCEEGEVNGDFLSSAAQRYIHSIWLESREENMGRHCWTNSLSNIMSSFSWMCPLCYHPIY